MNEIRVRSGIVVNVNDDGDTITINVEDQSFIDKLFGFYNRIDSVANEMNTPEMEEKSEREQLDSVIEKTKEIMKDIDGMFGDNACKKVFGDIIPSPYLIADFLDQLVPIANQYMDERQKKIAERYNRKRKGGSKYRTKEEIIQDAMR